MSHEVFIYVEHHCSPTLEVVCLTHLLKFAGTGQRTTVLKIKINVLYETKSIKKKDITVTGFVFIRKYA